MSHDRKYFSDKGKRRVYFLIKFVDTRSYLIVCNRVWNNLNSCGGASIWYFHMQTIRFSSSVQKISLSCRELECPWSASFKLRALCRFQQGLLLSILRFLCLYKMSHDRKYFSDKGKRGVYFLTKFIDTWSYLIVCNRAWNNLNSCGGASIWYFHMQTIKPHSASNNQYPHNVEVRRACGNITWYVITQHFFPLEYGYL
jgi:cAMP phosphodiesterase